MQPIELIDFRKHLIENENQAIENINNFLNNLGKEEPASKSFKNNIYNFSWTSLTNELKKYGYEYKSLLKQFERISPAENNQKEITLNNEYEDFKETFSVRIDSKVHNQLKELFNKYKMLPKAYVFSSLMEETLKDYFKN